MRFQPKFTKKEDIDKIINLYENNVTMKSIAKEFNCCWSSIKRVLITNNIKIKTNPGNRKYTFSEDYFNNINSHDKAQILGMLAADGCVCKNDIKIVLIEKDRDYLENIKIRVLFNGELKIYNVLKSKNRICSLTLNSQKMVNDLNKLGIFPRKSLVLKFPTFYQVPEKYINSFILGYFEGDGNININKAESSSVSICGTFEFCNSLALILKNTLNLNPSICKQGKKESNTYSVSFGGNLKVLTFLDWIYKDSVFQMKRKHNKYLWLKNKYAEMNKHGILTARKIGENSNLCKLKALDILDIRNRAEKGERNINIAKIYNISDASICNIVKYKRWKNLTKESLHLYQKI